MTASFRAVLRPEDAVTGGTLEKVLGSWLLGFGLDPNVTWNEASPLKSGLTVEARKHSGEGTSAERIVLSRARTHYETSTAITGIDQDCDHWIVVEQEITLTGDSADVPLVEVPNVIQPILESIPCFCGPTPLLAHAQELRGNEVVELFDQLASPDWSAPILLMAETPRRNSADLLSDAELLQKHALGLGSVYLLDEQARIALQSKYEDIAPAPGGLSSVQVTSGSPRFRAVQYPNSLIESQLDGICRRIQAELIDKAVSAPSPGIYVNRVARFPGFRRGQVGDGEQFLDDIVKLEEELDQLKAENRDLREDSELNLMEMDYLQQDLDDSERRRRYLEQRLRESGDHAALIAEIVDDEDVFDTCGSCAELIQAADSHSFLYVSDGLRRKAKELDTYPHSSLWTKKLRNALQAFVCYAEMKSRGQVHDDFLGYCADAPEGAVVLSDRCVALNESESTRTDPKCRAARTFSVPTKIDSTGEVFMGAHLKLATGGLIALRLHFHDDTAGSTGRICVGYVGPHLPLAG